MNKVELLSPAGSLEKLKYAVIYGADAVYCGVGNYSLRAQTANLSLEEVKQGVEFAHHHGVRVYVAVNIFAHNRDLGDISKFINSLTETRVDALIVADPGIFKLVSFIAPSMTIHLSTQANVTNEQSALFWQEQGAKRVTLARELGLSEIAQISQALDIETEVFVHGAMCLSYSGRCYLSNYLAQRDGNRGTCAQPCRWEYALVEEKRPGEYLPVFEDKRGSYILSSKDLCLAEHVPDLIKAGVSSLKIEGRMKSLHYVATVTKVYRQIIDDFYKKGDNFSFKEEWLEELNKVSHRQYSKGFLFEGGSQVEGKTSYLRTRDYVAVISGKKDGFMVLDVKNKLEGNQVLEVLTPQGSNCQWKLDKMRAVKTGENLSIAHANYKILAEGNLPLNSIVRKKVG